VRGMSSAFAATICGHVIRRQSELGIKGHIAEIGTFEGRFFIAMALGLAPGEHALGIDTFDWPNAGLLDLFHSHCARLGLARERYSAVKADIRDLSVADIQEALGGQENDKVRFWHLDGDHSREQLLLDLALAEATLHRQGIICLDDMLHPGYPLLVVAMHEWLERHSDWRVLCGRQGSHLSQGRGPAVRAGSHGYLQCAALGARLRMGALLLRRAHAASADCGGGLRPHPALPRKRRKGRSAFTESSRSAHRLTFRCGHPRSKTSDAARRGTPASFPARA